MRPTRPSLAVLFLIASATATLAQGAAAPGPAAAGPLQQFDTPASPTQTVYIMTRDFAPGDKIDRHIHHGVEMTIVMRGEIELTIGNAAPKVFHAGDSFLVPRDVPHQGRNPGTTPATISVTYVLDKGSPLRIPVP